MLCRERWLDLPVHSAPLPAPGLTWTSIKWMLRRDSPLYIAPQAAPSIRKPATLRVRWDA